MRSLPDDEVEGRSGTLNRRSGDSLSGAGVGGGRSSEEMEGHAPGERDGLPETRQQREEVGGETAIYESNPSPWGEKDR